MTIPLFVPAGEGPFVQIRDTKKTTFKLTTEDSDGQFGLFEHQMAPFAAGARAHVHRQTTEMFYVVKGEVEFVIGDRKEVGTPGAFASIPPDAPHGFTNAGSEQATLLIMFYPLNNREEYFRGLERLTADGRDPSLEELVELMSRYDQYLV
jgi:quercetin dioxygenase-like cupin family protein